jgi:hypothetical protein
MRANGPPVRVTLLCCGRLLGGWPPSFRFTLLIVAPFAFTNSVIPRLLTRVALLECTVEETIALCATLPYKVCPPTGYLARPTLQPKTTAQIREVFKKAFTAVGLPYYNPHSLRHTLAHFAMERCKSPEEMKAVAQNLAHNDVLTTFTSYGEVSRARQAEIIRSLGTPVPPAIDLAALARDVANLKTPFAAE